MEKLGMTGIFLSFKEVFKREQYTLELLYNVTQNIWNKEIQQNWIGAENYDNCFCLNFDRYYYFSLERRPGNRVYLHPILIFY